MSFQQICRSLKSVGQNEAGSLRSRIGKALHIGPDWLTLAKCRTLYIYEPNNGIVIHHVGKIHASSNQTKVFLGKPTLPNITYSLIGSEFTRYTNHIRDNLIKTLPNVFFCIKSKFIVLVVLSGNAPICRRKSTNLSFAQKLVGNIEGMIGRALKEAVCSSGKEVLAALTMDMRGE